MAEQEIVRYSGYVIRASRWTLLRAALRPRPGFEAKGEQVCPVIPVASRSGVRITAAGSAWGTAGWSPGGGELAAWGSGSGPYTSGGGGSDAEQLRRLGGAGGPGVHDTDHIVAGASVSPLGGGAGGYGGSYSRGGQGRNGDGTWNPTDGRGCPTCGAYGGGGHGGGCPQSGGTWA